MNPIPLSNDLQRITNLEASSSAHERLRTNEHDEQNDDEQHARRIGVTRYETEQLRIGGEQPFGHGESFVVQVRIVYYYGACAKNNDDIIRVYENIEFDNDRAVFSYTRFVFQADLLKFNKCMHVCKML